MGCVFFQQRGDGADLGVAQTSPSSQEWMALDMINSLGPKSQVPNHFSPANAQHTGHRTLPICIFQKYKLHTTKAN
jgi:hypothetical protein